MIEGAEEIKEAYRDGAVATEYIRNRFVQPLGALLHSRQVARMRIVLRESRARDVLEIAPGPARLTADLAATFWKRAVLVDASSQMLSEAQKRLAVGTNSRWPLVQGDAFQLPFRQAFDLVYSFRLIRHFSLQDRSRLYAGIDQVLKPGGLFVFDAINKQAAEPIRQRAGGAGQHYDALVNADELCDELSRAGFRVVDLRGVQHWFKLQYETQVWVAPRSILLARALMEVVDRLPGTKPLEWIVTCQKV